MTLLNSIITSFRTLSVIDFSRKIGFKLFALMNFQLYRKWRSIFYFKSLGVRMGKNVSLIGGCYSLKIGKDINVYNNCVFELGHDSKLEIGPRVIFSFGCVISANKSLKIGNDVQIGEYTSIRDTTHDYTDYGQPIMNNSDISSPIIIGNNVWIGRNCLIMPGTVIEDGVVIGANSLVKGTLKRDTIYGGNPIKVIKKRPSQLT
jgi:acetyltransferase-like isoleucine patch superfamily enzyme